MMTFLVNYFEGGGEIFEESKNFWKNMICEFKILLNFFFWKILPFLYSVYFVENLLSIVYVNALALGLLLTLEHF